MTDLSNKFSTFETQSASQHTELMEALNTIAYALGAPPTTPAITLGDLLTVMTALNNNIVIMKNADAAFHASMLSIAGFINVNTDTIITNNSINAQRILSAILSTACICPTDAPILAPPIDITPTSLVDEAKCRRIQFYLSVFGNWLDKIANYANLGTALTSGSVAALLTVVTTEAGIVAEGAMVGAAAGPPGIVAGALIGLLVTGVLAIGGTELVDYANQFNDPTLRDNMVQAMYAATNADEGYDAFNSVLLASMDTIPAQLIKTMWWSAWSNDIYSGVPVVDDSAFDGSICGAPPLVTGCWSPTAEQITNVAVTETNNGSTAGYSNCVIWPVDWAVGNTYAGTNSGGFAINIVGNANFVWNADVYGLWVSLPSGSLYSDNEVIIATGATYQQITVHTAYVFVISGNTGFTICETQPV